MFKTFIVPQKLKLKTDVDVDCLCVYAIVPSYIPSRLTVSLVSDLLRWNKKIKIIVVDDSSPKTSENIRIFNEINHLSERVTLMRTSENKMKAGAINLALAYILKKSDMVPDVVVTLDDDVIITKTAIAKLAESLAADERLGAVCAQNRVANKNKNIFTRLQGLEYVGFNIMRMADQGFFYGPLVMPGMLTAFRWKALKAVHGFSEGHLIEDYDITVKMKELGFMVRFTPEAQAFTQVPESMGELWRQRARWIYGGLLVVGGTRMWRTVIQDWIGHGMFVASLALIAALLLLPWGHSTSQAPKVVIALIALFAITQFILWYVFQLWIMRFYPERDKIDWLIRIFIIPELFYANFMTAVLAGAYVFHTFMLINDTLSQIHRPLVHWCLDTTRRFFGHIGYTTSWGTRNSHEHN